MFKFFNKGVFNIDTKNLILAFDGRNFEFTGDIPSDFEETLDYYREEYSKVLLKNLPKHPAIEACEDLRNAFSYEDIKVMNPAVVRCWLSAR